MRLQGLALVPLRALPQVLPGVCAAEVQLQVARGVVSPGPPSEVVMSLSALLRSARQSAGLTLVQVAERSGLSTTFVCDLEHGRRGAAPATLERVGRVLGLDVDLLFAAQGELPPDLRVALSERPALIRKVRAVLMEGR